MENIKKLALVLIVSCMIWSCDNDTPSDELIDASHQEDSIDVRFRYSQRILSI